MARVRISASLKKSTEGIAKAYAEFNDLTFSESVEILTGLSGNEWFAKLPSVKQREYVKKFNIFTPIK